MRKPVLLVLLLLLAGCSLQDKPRPGYFDPLGPTIWKGDIQLTENCWIGSGDTLIIEEGSTVSFKGGSVILIDGSIQIRGSRSAPVTFLNSGWIILSDFSTNNTISWCNVASSTLSIASSARVSSSRIGSLQIMETGDPFISNSLIGYMVCRNTSSPSVSRSQFDRSGFFSDTSPVVIRTYDTATPSVSECNILGNSTLTPVMSNSIVLLYSSAQNSFRNNWWTTADSFFVTNRLIFRSLATTLWYTPVASTRFPIPPQ